MVVLEAPEVAIGGVTTNGGSGSACGIDGNDATPNKVVAPGIPGCGNHNQTYSGGGGTVDLTPTDGGGFGGGGAVGVMFVDTIDGTYASITGSIISAYVTVGLIVPL